MRTKSKGNAILTNLLWGFGVTVILLLIFMLIAALLTMGQGGDRLLVPVCVAGAALSIAAGAFVAGMKNRCKGLLVGALHSAAVIIFMILLSLIFRGGQVQIFSTKLLIYLLGGTLVSVLGAIFGVNFKRRR